MQSLSSQFFAFGVTVLMGITVGTLFDFYRVTKGVVCQRKVFAYLGDLLFWVISTLVVFFLLLIGNWGEVRFYVVIGVLAGALAYIKLFSRLVVTILLRLIALIKKGAALVVKLSKFIWLVVTYPLILAKNTIIIPIGYLGMACTKTLGFTGRLWDRYILGPSARKTKRLKSNLKQKLDSLFKKE